LQNAQSVVDVDDHVSKTQLGVDQLVDAEASAPRASSLTGKVPQRDACNLLLMVEEALLYGAGQERRLIRFRRPHRVPVLHWVQTGAQHTPHPLPPQSQCLTFRACEDEAIVFRAES